MYMYVCMQSCWLVVHGKVYDVTDFLEVRGCIVCVWVWAEKTHAACCTGSGPVMTAGERWCVLTCCGLLFVVVVSMQEHPGGYDIIVTSAGEGVHILQPE